MNALAISSYQWDGRQRDSAGEHFFANKMEADDLGRLALIEVTADSVTNLLAQFIKGLRLGKNGLAESAGGETSFHCFFYQKDEFVHDIRVNSTFTLP